MKMPEQEYQDKLKVRTQLSLADKFRVLEHEFEVLKEMMTAIQIRLSEPAKSGDFIPSVPLGIPQE